MQSPLPSQREAKLYYLTMIGLNLWQKPQQAAVAAPLYASQITQAKGFCPAAAANAALVKTNFDTCRSAATVGYLFRTAHELGAPPVNVVAWQFVAAR